MTRKKHTPWILLLIGGFFLALMVWSIYLAGQKTSAVTDRDYYSHGLRYNETQLERRTADSLGWTTRIELTGHQLTIYLVDRDQKPVLHATSELNLLTPGNLITQRIDLEEIAPGTFRTTLPDDLHGEQPAELQFEREGARLTKRLLLNL